VLCTRDESDKSDEGRDGEKEKDRERWRKGEGKKVRWGEQEQRHKQNKEQTWASTVVVKRLEAVEEHIRETKQ
jgi:hypothetical protein